MNIKKSWLIQAIVILISISFHSMILLVPLYATDPIEEGGLAISVQVAFSRYGSCYAYSFIVPFLVSCAVDGLGRRDLGLLVGLSLMFSGALGLLYATSSSFFLVFGLFMSGYGSVKTLVNTLIGDIFSQELGSSHLGFHRFYICACVGFVLAGIIGGGLYEHFSFQSAALFVCVLLLIASSMFIPLLHVTAQPPQKAHSAKAIPSIVWLMLILSVPYFCCYAQMNTSMNYYLYHYVHRYVGNFEIPAAWLNVSATGLVSIGAFFWHKKSAIGWRQLRVGLILAGMAFAAIWIGTVWSALPDAILVVGAYMMIGTGDLLVRPMLYSIVNNYVVSHRRSIAVSIVYVVFAAGVKLGSWLAGSCQAMGFEQFFGLAFWCVMIYIFILSVTCRWIEKKNPQFLDMA